MHTINTMSNLKLKVKNFLLLWFKERKNPVLGRKSYIAILIFGFYILGFSAGCLQKPSLEQINNLAQKSQEYYERAIEGYKNLIRRGKDLERIYLMLGKLYFSHGDYMKAQEVLKKTNDIRAKKFLAMSYYHLGNFTEALEIFHKYQLDDKEYLYYHGLT
ncbi:MAG: tetratricopeptide repeat protein, partial [Candidatus Omnitrophica bacterium]|nr:tetratricopeptide repeat protein [Candidatus Omnitrophota bacterium]